MFLKPLQQTTGRTKSVKECTVTVFWWHCKPAALCKAGSSTPYILGAGACNSKAGSSTPCILHAPSCKQDYPLPNAGLLRGHTETYLLVGEGFSTCVAVLGLLATPTAATVQTNECESVDRHYALATLQACSPNSKGRQLSALHIGAGTCNSKGRQLLTLHAACTQLQAGLYSAEMASHCNVLVLV